MCISFSYDARGFSHSPFSEVAAVFAGAEHVEVILNSAENSSQLKVRQCYGIMP